MSSTYIIVPILILLFIGINLSANNSFITFVLKYFFYGSTSTKALVRFLGIIILGSIVLILMQLYYYAIVVIICVIIVFTFFTIQGRNKAKSIAEYKSRELKSLHKAQVEQRKIELAKTRSKKIKELEKSRHKPQSVRQMKEKMWDDGSKTNKELIRDLKK